VNQAPFAAPGSGGGAYDQEGGSPNSVALSLSSGESFTAAAGDTIRNTKHLFDDEGWGSPRGGGGCQAVRIANSMGGGAGSEAGGHPQRIGSSAMRGELREDGGVDDSAIEGSSSDLEDSPVVAQSTLRKAHR
jgi:hypothetical protein